MAINQELLATNLPRDAVGFCVALSGGIDSVVLLHAMHAYCQKNNFPLRAIHVHHGLQSEADQWVVFCQQLCHSMQVPLDVHYGSARVVGVSVEVAARNLRYQYFSKRLQPGHCLVLGHHQQDQVETCLLNLVKGAGPQGLSGMRLIKLFAAGWLSRPLLTVSPEQISTYAESNQLTWVEDPSNVDVAYERNYIRHEILPVYIDKWPAAMSSMARAALLQQSSVDFTDATIESSEAGLREDGTIDLDALLILSKIEQRLSVRSWLKRVGVTPSMEQLDTLFNEVVDAAMDRNPELEFGGWVVKRSKRSLYCVQKGIDQSEFAHVEIWTLNTVYARKGVYLEPYFLLNTYPMLTPESQVNVMQRHQLIERGYCTAKRFKSICHSLRIPVWRRDELICISYGEKILQIVGFYGNK